MSTPSPSKRPRVAQASSAAPSPFAFHSAHMAARPTPPAPPPMSSLAAFSTMSPADSFSPFNHATSGLASGVGLGTAFGTPYAGGSAATSPISTALFHGSKVLSNIQPSDNLPSSSVPKQPASAAAVPQQGSPQHLRLALQHLQETLIATLEGEAETYFDAVELASTNQSDSRIVYQKAQAFEAALQSVLTHLERQGLAFVPLLPLPALDATSSNAEVEQANQQTASSAPPVEDPIGTTNDNDAIETAPSSLAQQTQALQQQAKQLYGRRQRLTEAASIVAGILSD